MNDGPVFIVANRRSGTTMLRLMLAAHPRIGIPPEGGFVVTMGWIWGRSELSSSDYRALVEAFFCEDNAQDWGMSPGQLMSALEERCPSTFAEFVDEVYRLYLRLTFPGKSRWGDKTTWYLDFVPMITELVPNARFVTIVRDGRDVACSYRNTKHLTHDIRALALEWVTSVETARRASALLGEGRFFQLQYEHLTADPRRELERLCRFLGEEFSEGMLAFHQQNTLRRLEPERHMEWKKRTTEAADTASVGRWRTELEPPFVAEFERFAGSTLSRLGYELASPALSPRHRVAAEAQARAFGAYWRGRQALRGSKARFRRRLNAVRR